MSSWRGGCLLLTSFGGGSTSGSFAEHPGALYQRRASYVRTEPDRLDALSRMALGGPVQAGTNAIRARGVGQIGYAMVGNVACNSRNRTGVSSTMSKSWRPSANGPNGSGWTDDLVHRSPGTGSRFPFAGPTGTIETWCTRPMCWILRRRRGTLVTLALSLKNCLNSSSGCSRRNAISSAIPSRVGHNSGRGKAPTASVYRLRAGSAVCGNRSPKFAPGMSVWTPLGLNSGGLMAQADPVDGAGPRVSSGRSRIGDESHPSPPGAPRRP